MKRVKIKFTFRDFSVYYQIDDGDGLANLEMVVAELNDELEPKLQEDGKTLTEEYKKEITKDIFELYSGLQSSNEMEYKGKKIVRTIDKNEYVDTDQTTTKNFNGQLSEPMNWVKNVFLPVYADSHEKVPYEKLPDNTVMYTILKNKLDFPSSETVSTLLQGIEVQVLKK